MQKMMGLFRRKSSTKSASSGLSKLRKEPPTPALPPPPLQLPQTPRNGSSDPSPSNGQSTPLSTFSSFGASDPQNSRSTVTLPSSVDDQDFAVTMGGVDHKHGGLAVVNSGRNDGSGIDAKTNANGTIRSSANRAVGGGGFGNKTTAGADANLVAHEAPRSKLEDADDNETATAASTTASAIYRTKSAPQQRPKKLEQAMVVGRSRNGNNGGGNNSLVPAPSHEQQQQRHHIPSRRPSNASQGTAADRAEFRQSNATITPRHQSNSGKDQTPRKQQPQHQVNQAQSHPQQQPQISPQHQLVPHNGNSSGSSSNNLPSEWRDREPSVFSRFTHSPTPSESASMQYAHSIASNTTLPRPHTSHGGQGYHLNNSSSSLINNNNNNNNNSSPINNNGPNTNKNNPLPPHSINPPLRSNSFSNHTSSFNHHHPFSSSSPNNNNKNHNHNHNQFLLHPPNPSPNSRHRLHPNDPQRSRYPPGPGPGQQRHPPIPPHHPQHLRSPIPPIPPLPPGIRSGNYRNQHGPLPPRHLPALPENTFVNNRSRPPPRQRNPYPPSAMPPSMMTQNNRQQQPISSNPNSPPRNNNNQSHNKNVQPTPGPQSMIIHFTPSQLNCLLQHSDLKKMGNFHHSMPCMTCRKMSVDGMFYCSYCSLRICKTCSARLHKEWKGDITKGWGAVEVLSTNDTSEPRRPATAHGGKEYVVRWGTESRPGTADTTATTASLPMSQTIMKVNSFFNASGNRPGSSHLRPSTASFRPSPLNQLQANNNTAQRVKQQQQQKPDFGINISFDNPDVVSNNAGGSPMLAGSTPELVHPVPTHYKVNSLLERTPGSISPQSGNSSQQSPVSPLEPSINISNGTLDSRVSGSHSQVASNLTVSSVGMGSQIIHEKADPRVDIITELAMEPKIKRKGLKGMFARK